jgi:hypothetical protein
MPAKVSKPYAIVNPRTPLLQDPRSTPPEQWTRMTIGRETAQRVYERESKGQDWTDPFEPKTRVIARFGSMDEADAFLLTAQRAVQAHQLALNRAREDMTRAQARIDISKRDLRAAVIQWWQEHGKDWGQANAR